MRGAQINRSIHSGLVYEKVYSAREIIVVNPRHKLIATTTCATKTAPNQCRENIKGAALVRTHDDCRSQCDFTRVRRQRIEKCIFPALCDVNAEPPSVRRFFFV